MTTTILTNTDKHRIELLDDALDQQYKKLEQQRRYFREHLIDKIQEGLDTAKNVGIRVRTLFEIFRDEAKLIMDPHQESDKNSLSAVARAIQELIGPDIESVAPQDIADAFAKLIEAVSDRDQLDDNGDGELDPAQSTMLWCSLAARLHEEFNRPEGGFARLMNGETRPHTRRLLQQAFNRKPGYPRVLVAQSMVGREGLNLHEACRTVVLLHPEWNPGIVEQQIGRVDRIGSLWENKLREALDNNDNELPRIEIRPVIFKGTYDEHNWQVLRARWDNLRAQLHGVVISPEMASKLSDQAIIEEINGAAPNFSPT